MHLGKATLRIPRTQSAHPMLPYPAPCSTFDYIVYALQDGQRHSLRMAAPVTGRSARLNVVAFREDDARGTAKRTQVWLHLPVAGSCSAKQSNATCCTASTDSRHL